MSRIDEALKRARREAESSPVADLPVKPPPAAAGDVNGNGLPQNMPTGDSSVWRDENYLPAADEIEDLTLAEEAEIPPPAAVEQTLDTLRADPRPAPEPSNNGGYLAHLAGSEKLVIGSDVDAATIEEFRRLAARLYLSQAERGTRLVMVASALAGEGKTLTAANLALTLSQSYKRQVLLIDGDLRRPSAHDVFRVPNVSGLNDGIRSAVERRVPLIRISEHLSLLTAGRPDADPMSVLSSDRIRRVLEEAREKFEWVIIDTPPLRFLTDANLLASLVDAAVLVVEAGRTPAAAIQQAVTAIGRDRIAGVVLNRVSPDQVHPDYADYAYSIEQQA